MFKIQSLLLDTVGLLKHARKPLATISRSTVSVLRGLYRSFYNYQQNPLTFVVWAYACETEHIVSKCKWVSILHASRVPPI